MDTVGVERKEEQCWTVYMVKLGKKQLCLQCYNATGTVSIYQLFFLFFQAVIKKCISIGM